MGYEGADCIMPYQYLGTLSASTSQVEFEPFRQTSHHKILERVSWAQSNLFLHADWEGVPRYRA